MIVTSKFDYKYHNVGNRTEVAEADGSRATWTYDNTYQLLAEHRTGTSPYRNTFTYDKNGNRLPKNENNARTTSTYDAANQLKTSVDAQGTTTYVYDADGNQELVQSPTGARTTTTWDYENKTTLVELPSGVRNTMSYEPDGLRVKLEESSGTKKFIYDNQTYLSETDENNNTQAVYTNEPTTYGNLISQHRKSGAIWTPSYYHQDVLGSTTNLTGSTESVTDAYLYDAWGNLISSTGISINPFQFTGNVGYYYDPDTGNFYIRARIYRPTIGRWLSMDPLGFMDGLGRFRFSLNSPLHYYDPSGMKCECCEWVTYTPDPWPYPNFYSSPTRTVHHTMRANGCREGEKSVDRCKCGAGFGKYGCCDAVDNAETITIPIKVWNWNGGGGPSQARQAVNTANSLWKQCCIRFEWDRTVNNIAQNAGGRSRNMPISPRAPSFPPAHPILVDYNTVNTIDVHLVPGFKEWVTPIPPRVLGVNHKSGHDPLAIARGVKREVLAHEIGHALGLKHSGSETNLMHVSEATNYIFYSSATELTIPQCDKARATAEGNYGAVPD